MRLPLALLLAALPSLPSFAARTAPPPRSGWLWHIVSRCVDAKAPDYCDRCLRPAPGLCGEVRCEDRTVVWRLSKSFVAIRDMKMCGCPKGFVHGLALPRTPVTGVEDPRRPVGIWAFAWKAARAEIADPGEILLAVNAPWRRSQSQLHVHLIRLAPGARARLEALKPGRAASLDGAWAAAARDARREGLKGWYGVAVARAGDGKSFLVLADGGGHPETRFGIARCR
ncbi:MAG: CDP-diacylglycerol diphosphatase [Elusimicrobia bacterium]|nr:CDP-diacylglycerol diphosphatase [Elusimicrobiota bacterium]